MPKVTELHALKILQLSDLHLFGDNEKCLEWGEKPAVNPFRNLQSIFQLIQSQQEHYDAVIVTGDIAQEEPWKVYSQLTQLFETLTAPVYFLPGNHDDVQLLRLAASNGYCALPEQIVIGSWVIFMIDSCVTGKNGGFLSPQRLRRIRTLSSEYDQFNQLIALHHPPIDIGSCWLDSINLRNASELFETLEQCPQVKGIISGHVHQAFETHVNNIHISSAPATCVQFEPKTMSQTFSNASPGYRVFHLYRDGSIETRAIYLDEHEIQIAL